MSDATADMLLIWRSDIDPWSGKSFGFQQWFGRYQLSGVSGYTDPLVCCLATVRLALRHLRAEKKVLALAAPAAEWLFKVQG